jgi:hypothetical protein
LYLFYNLYGYAQLAGYTTPILGQQTFGGNSWQGYGFDEMPELMLKADSQLPMGKIIRDEDAWRAAAKK